MDWKRSTKAIEVIFLFFCFVLLGAILHKHLFLYGVSLIIFGVLANMHSPRQWE
jgi:hypothetical protein